jgi:hypothetical protein
MSEEASFSGEGWGYELLSGLNPQARFDLSPSTRGFNPHDNHPAPPHPTPSLSYKGARDGKTRRVFQTTSRFFFGALLKYVWAEEITFHFQLQAVVLSVSSDLILQSRSFYCHLQTFEVV